MLMPAVLRGQREHRVLSGPQMRELARTAEAEPRHDLLWRRRLPGLLGLQLADQGML